MFFMWRFDVGIFSVPVRLVQNKIVRYPGGRELDRFRGIIPPLDDGRPEAWVGSTVTTRGAGGGGKDPDDGRASCVLADGRELLLRDAVLMDKEGALGREHLERYGDEPAVLLKLLDAQHQLGFQCHPSPEYALEHWGSRYGKAECWYVVSLRGDTAEPPYVLLGFKEGVTRDTFAALYDEGDIAGLERLLHKMIVKPGETYWVAAGVPHAVGPGVFCIEAQEPSDITVGARRLAHFDASVTAEQEAAHRERLLGAYAYDGCTLEENLRRTRIEPKELSRSSDGYSHEYLLLGPAQTPFFALTRIEARAPFTPHPTGRCAILIVTEGMGELRCDGGSLPIKKGDEVFIGAEVRGLMYVPEGERRLTVIAAHPPGTAWE